jgi:CHAT domain-containing protein/tetratricopeptide (TPR) repeat protein
MGYAFSPAQAQADAQLKALNIQVVELFRAGKFSEAIPLAQRYADLIKARHGPDHAEYADALGNLALALKNASRFSEAEPLYRRALSIDERNLGPEHPRVAIGLNNLAQLLHATNRLSEAEPLMRRALAIDEKGLGPEHPIVAIRLNNLAGLLQDTGRLSEAEPLMRRALAIDEKSLGPEYPDLATDLNNLADLLQDTNRLSEAEPLMRRALAIDEKSLGPEHPKVANDLNNLAELLRFTNRRGQAEPLLRRALAIDERNLGLEHPSVAIRLNNLGGLLQAVNQLREAEPMFRRALAIDEKKLGPEHPNVALRLNNLAGLLQAMNQSREAEAMFRRALAIDEKSFGPWHPRVATRLNNLGQLLKATARLREAEPLLRRALAIDEKSFGPTHPDVGRDLNNLGLMRAELGDWAEAARLHRQAKPIMTANGNRTEDADLRLTRVALAANTWNLRASARAVYRANPETVAAREDAFEMAQWALQTGAADALSQMSVRFAKGTGPLATLVRERQDIITRRQSETHRLDMATGRADANAADEARGIIGVLDTKLASVDARITTEFKEYAELANPKPLTIAATQALLEADEALVLFLDVPQFGKLPEESLIWVVTKSEARWFRGELGTKRLAERVRTLRAGLDSSAGAARGDAEPVRNFEAVGNPKSERNFLPFDLAVAHELYVSLFGPVADLIRGKHLLVVPSGPLTSIPFHLLVTERPDKAIPDSVEGYKEAAWLAKRNAITILPSVGSLQALRQLPPSRAREPYIAFGNPLLLGRSGNDKSAWGKQRCAQPAATRMAQAEGMARRGVSLRAIDLVELRGQEPLPETADELCAVAGALGALARQNDTVWLGERATERNLKRLSREGKLARYKMLHFATHGLLAGESEAILKAKAEPALILTPPGDGTTAADLEEDDGVLTASEVAQLKLDADWIVLSACNTAAGDKGDAEALSGLARAFFYAKARALLVSHWPVNSDAAVKLTTRAFAELATNPQIGRAEALRRSMAELITKGAPREAHPANWAPFVLVGEGAR